MATVIDQAFRQQVLNVIAAQVPQFANAPVEKGRVDADQVPTTRIQYQRATEDQETFLDGATPGLGDVTFDVEIQALNDDDTQLIVAALKAIQPTGLNGFRGLIGGSTIWAHGIFIGDHGDEYQPRLLNADEGYSVSTFQAQVLFDEAVSEQ